MPISRITIRSAMTGKDLIFDLNTIQQGWVAQLIEGTFSDTGSYSFTDGNLTSVEASSIDINIRLTPVVPITERTPEEILNFLSGASRESKVTLRDTDVPDLSINYNTTGNVVKAELSELPSSDWSQKCVIREIKYNYSENPATIEFTVSTTKPFLTGPTMHFYFGLKNTPDSDTRVQFYKIFDRLRELNVYGDIEELKINFVQSNKGFDRTIRVTGFPYIIYIKTEDPNQPCELNINTNSNGSKTFGFRRGANHVSSYAYMTEAYPMFNPSHVRYLLETYGYSSSQFNTTYGQTKAYVKFVQIKRGL